jgi:single-strand DNA-binding protein
MDLNRATILGRLTRDPEVKNTPNGKTVASLSVATNSVWTDKSGAKQEKAEYHNCVLWGKIAEIAGQYLTKGKRVYVEGRIQTRDWVGQDGVKRYRTEINVDNMIMLDGGTSRGGSAPAAFDSGVSHSNQSSAPSNEDDGFVEEVKVEDIPF